MTYASVDALQKTLQETVFSNRADSKKAAGRALGTLVEIITFYTLRAWSLRDFIAIERAVPEFANPEIMHNVEFSLHPVMRSTTVTVEPLALPLSIAKMRRLLPQYSDRQFKDSAQALTSSRVKRNACVIIDDDQGMVVVNVDDLEDSCCQLVVCELRHDPFAVIECKRVGVEEGMRKGPQTIEKAKQGAYVARAVSALQKVRLRSGEFQGVLETGDGTLRTAPYDDLLRELIEAPEGSAAEGFVLTIGVVSNHGNWFTSANQNKELKVLAQSYDWLLFLTDLGLSKFIDRLLLNPSAELAPARDAFLASYADGRTSNSFTKVLMSVPADQALCQYFADHESEVETWFNVIAPARGTVDDLRTDLDYLTSKDW